MQKDLESSFYFKSIQPNALNCSSSKCGLHFVVTAALQKTRRQIVHNQHK